MAWWQTYFDELYIALSQQLRIYGAKDSQQQAQAVVQMTRLTPPAKILDLCCGTGRHAIPLARMGFVVTGLDSRTTR